MQPRAPHGVVVTPSQPASPVTTPFPGAAAPDAAELWPSVGEYPVYDRLLYHLMTHDDVRNGRYREALRDLVRDKVVVDVGTGQDANWARACVDAGARRVYAIEEIGSAFDEASRLVQRLGLADRIHLLHGPSLAVELPERADVCVSEIIGLIGSSEGVAVALNDARRRLLKPGGVMVPHRCVTRIAALRLPDHLCQAPVFKPAAARYARRVFQEVGRRFDLRVCVRNLPPDALLSEPATFEDLDFGEELPTEQSRDVRLEITRSGRLDGVLLWINLWCAAGARPIDALAEETSWSPVVFPVFSPGIHVQAGDRISLRCRSWLSDNGRNPDYGLEGRAWRRHGYGVDFAFLSRHHGGPYRNSPFYAALLGGVEAGTVRDGRRESR
jgi:hypothetical protein